MARTMSLVNGCWQWRSGLVEVIHPMQEVSPVELQGSAALLVSPTLFMGLPLTEITSARDDGLLSHFLLRHLPRQ